MIDRCLLCGQDKALRESHIIPKFVGKWIKETSATGFLAKATNASRRVQDLTSMYLLCNDCEERFSKFETYFASKIFFPFHKEHLKSFKYNGMLEKFVISLSWRVLKVEYDKKFKTQHPDFVSHMDEAESHWREFLLGNKLTSNPYENHLFFLDYVQEGKEIPQKFNWYALRGIDATLGFSSERVFVYVKLPWMCFVSSIYPKVMKGWEGTKIKDKGTITIPQLNKDAEFGSFLLQRSLISQTSSQGPTEKQSMDRILKAIKKNPKKVLESETLTTMIMEQDNQRKQKMKNMPNTVINLVEEVILRLEDDPNKEKSENRMIKWSSRHIADALASLSKEESEMLDNVILTTIRQAKLLNDDAQIMLKTNSIWVTFMVNPNSTKEYQRVKILEEINDLKRIRGENKIPLAVFAMNPSESDVSWECGFIT